MNPRTLLFYLSSKKSYRPVLISENEVFCGPDEVDSQVGEHIQTINTTPGQFDVRDVLKKLPEEQWPELLVVKTDASGRLLPRNLSSLNCPKVLILGDTHHLEQPIRFLLEYMRMESFDVVLTDHDRHHLDFFLQAGVPRLHWIPALNYCMRPRPILPPRENKAIFVGQLGRFHPYRRALFSSLAETEPRLSLRMARPEDTAELYARHAVSLNCSLNGDLNLRVFEIIGSGGLLLTDRLSEESGLDLCFRENEHMLCYRDIGELRERVAYCLENPDYALRIWKEGFEELQRSHTPEIKRRQLMDLVFNDKEDPAYALDDARKRASVTIGEGLFGSLVPIYEFIQESHSSSSKLTLFAEDPNACRVFADLPRVEIVDWKESAGDIVAMEGTALLEDRVLVIGAGSISSSVCRERLDLFTGFKLVVIGANSESSDTANALEHFGYVGDASYPGAYQRHDYGYFALKWHERALIGAAVFALNSQVGRPAEANVVVACAQLSLQVGESALACAFLEEMIRRDRLNSSAYRSLASARHDMGDTGGCLVALLELDRIEELTGDAKIVCQALVDDPVVRSDSRVSEYLDRIGATGGGSLIGSAKRILVYTNLFPPQELGGYGRKMWEFARELKRRGHELYVLAGDAPYLYKEPQAEEAELSSHTHYDLHLYGEWRNGSVALNVEESAVGDIALENRLRLEKAIGEFDPDFCLAGNLDLIGHIGLESLAIAGIPTIQCLGNFIPGWPSTYAPSEKTYRPGPASNWLSNRIAQQGFTLNKPRTLYPGARIDLFYRHWLPDLDMPRIMFAGLLMAYKGAHVLVGALQLLRESGIEFRATIAGDSTDREYVDRLKKIVGDAGMEDQVTFPGFLNRSAIKELYARSNILVFPSVFEEPFGISQVEALASGLTVITSGTGGSGEIIENEKNGLIFESENPQDLAAKIASLVADPESWAALCRAGRERAFEFSIPQTVDRIEEVFQEIAAPIA